MAFSPSTRVYLEVGPKRTFACALDWPGWCRVDRGDDAALEMLAAYAPRYAKVAARAGLKLPRIAVDTFEIVERIAGTPITDFGAPVAVPAADMQPVDARTARRDVALLAAAWAELDSVAAAAPASLRKGPRGGGRDRDAMVEHVVNAERSYARKVGVHMSAEEWRDGGVEVMRARLREVLGAASSRSPAVEGGWPARYVTRRTAWHALDHAWEMQDKSR